MRNGTVRPNSNPTGVVAHRCLTVELLTGETISLAYEGKTTCNAIWNRVEGELVARGVVHPQIFGLAIQSGSEWVFVDPDAKLSKYYCKEGKTTPGQYPGAGSVSDGKKLAFHCRVHFYLDALPQNFDIVSLHHYYIQLRQNLVSTPRFPPASIIKPLAYALQFELGDWKANNQEFPRWIHSQPLILSMAPSLSRAHQTLSGLEKEAAQLAFIRAVMPQYNMHLFAMKLKTKEDSNAPAWIGVTPKGIEVYQNAVTVEEPQCPAQPRLTFLWASITKLYFEKKKYGIHGKAFPWANSDQKLSFTATTECVPRHMLHLCRSTHQFHLSNHKILLSSESQQVSNGHKSSVSSIGTGGESSCNSTLLSSSSKNDDKMLDLSLWADGLLLTGESSEHQRVSVISNASSNTTSGIVSSSDRVYSLDGSEEDLELREMPDCCTERAHNHDRNSTSLESLSPRHPPPPRPHLPRIHSHHTHRTTSSSNCNGGNSSKSEKCGSGAALVVVEGEEEEEEEEEAKYWYCDSDCEDCEDSGPCRSMLVRTIGDKQRFKCAGHCECNSCVTDEEHEDEEGHHHHNNTPSMASETTLKAVDFDTVDGGGGNKCEFKSVKEGAKRSKNKDKVQSSESDENNEGDNGEIEEYKLEDEHVYGEISEDPEPLNQSANSANNTSGSGSKMKTEEEQQYSTIEGEDGDDSLRKVKTPKPKPRYSCIKSIEHKSGCKCKVKENKCYCSDSNKKLINGSSNPSCCKKSVHHCAKECKKCFSSPSNVMSSIGKENGLTPKVASLKCLRKPKPSCSSNIRRHISNRINRGEINFAEHHHHPPVNYVEFGEKLQQGRYPSTRTVSDNFDTDSDYVQLPPLAWYPPPRPPPKKPNSLKLWKCVSKSGNVNGKAKQVSPPSLSPPVNMSTLPRRNKTTEQNSDVNDGCSNNKSNLRASKVSSKSTTALNLVGHAKPEPPPKPRKSMADLSSVDNKIKNNKGSGAGNSAVDARFIATKPQILIQTAYATTAPVAIPSQVHVLVRGSKVASNNSHLLGAPVLQHSQSVDNIYDTVACEEPQQPSTFTITPPPYPTKVSAAPLIIRPNNYIDVHASSIKNKLSTKPYATSAIANHYITNPGGVNNGGHFVGKNVNGIGNRCGSVPNNLNNFLIGLQNLKPLSRTPIVHPGATSCLTLNKNTSNNAIHTNNGTQLTICNRGPLPVPSSTPSCSNPHFTTVYTNQLTRSQIQQFKAQLYSDLDYVIFPPKDPRVSQQEYFDSKYTTVSSTNSNPMLTSGAYQINDIPPPYLPPPPPYPSTAAANAMSSNVPPPLPKKNPKLPARPNYNSSTNVTSLNNRSISSPYHHNSFQSLYNPGSTNSHCSSSQYGYYTAASTAGLNSENLQRFLSTQSFTGSNGSSAPIYYPSSTQSAPPLPPYKPSGHVIIENGMRKAQHLITSRNSASVMTASDERLRMNMKLCRSEESLYSQPTNETEEHMKIYNLPPPPPYKRPSNPRPSFSAKQEAFSAAELDLAHLRARCHALELPLLRALCSEGELLNKDKSTKALIQAAKNRIRPTAHAHPRLSLPPKNPLPMPPKPNNATSHQKTTAS